MDLLISVGLPLALAFIMFSLGTGLSGADFRRVLTRPGAFTIGAVHQIVLIPVVAFVVITLFGITGAMAVGVMILAACPGGVTSNIVARLARADVALSVSLTAVISLLSAVTVPLILAASVEWFEGGQGPDVDITGTAITMFALTVVPILIGLACRKVFPNAMARAEPVLVRISSILFAVVILGALVSNLDLFIDNLPVLGPVMVVIIAALASLGYVVPRLLGRSTAEAKTISIETGIQNGTLGITVATLLTGAEAGFTAYSTPSAVYGVLMYLILVPVLTLFRRRAD